MVASETPVVTRDAQGDRLLTYSVLNDFMGAPVLVLRSTRARNISAIGRRVLLASMAGIAVSAMLVMGVTVLLLRWLLIKPLETFTDQVVDIGRTGELGQRVALERNDEIGTLSREFGKMLERLANARDQSLERSYNTGLAEMAVGVLHNLRNHITPLSMQVGRFREHLLRFPGANVSLAYEELTTRCPDAERKQKLDQYIKLSLQDCRLRNEQIVQWLQRVSDDLRHLDSTLSELERFGKSSNQYTPILVSKVVEEVIAQLPDCSVSNTSIEISCHLGSNVAVLSTPFILKHILHNLLVNACEAIVAANRPQGRIEVVQILETSGDRNRVDLQVRDNGIGIAPDQLNTVFTRGFSTKIGERRGTGLHWCANSVAKMGGELFATSPGIDRGAVLHLLLPLAVADMHAAA
ncbi:MAG: HAMP domain-containing histidine kinase [Defluviicoccus sp.]|nr:MAG: HAMP domain-containing histidine kinase [Defluviicoccus sp.]